ncbi:phosphoenolpyruvate synthase, partial [Desulfococcaceae bacterium OttesenSCG-928-F15]|nr:phosphoenolpyruvate synthase [Desulfococcaceae bacterium OttesenSCG-928-F15]
MGTIIGNIKQFFSDLKQSKVIVEGGQSSEMNSVFRFRYSLFKELLSANSDLLSTMSDMDEKLKGEEVFGFIYIRNQSNKSLQSAFKMAKCINVMSGGKYQGLFGALERINEGIKDILSEKKFEPAPVMVSSYKDIALKDADWVGGKNANLGEITQCLDIPVPKGFAITTGAFHRFFEFNDLGEEITRKKNLLYGDEVDALNALSEETIRLIMEKPMPDDLCEEIFTQCGKIWPNMEGKLLAMRSSAVGEDGEISFAGQYLTELGITRDRIIESYKAIIASLFSARSMSYRITKGLYDEDLAMAVACLEMVDSIASGVMYTRHPYDITNENILINAVWGLGPYAVDGVITPDTYMVTKDEKLFILEKLIIEKPVQLVLKPEGDVEEIAVPEDLKTAPCLTEEQIRTLAGYAMALEEHYQCPQDVEWALAPDGRLVVLQSRPLKIQNPKDLSLVKAKPLTGYTLLADHCEIASQGVGHGSIFQVHSTDDLSKFPEGGVLLARHSSPEYVVIMHHASAIIIEAGSVSGHMAALAREFDVPTVIAPHPLMQAIPTGTEVTVDAYTGRVYQGEVTELLQAVKKKDAYMKGTPIYEYLQRVAEFVTPLNLVNPESRRFRAEKCKTLHDIARFCHEFSYNEMFQISDIASKHLGWSLKLAASLPMDIHLIDLGDGLKTGIPIRRYAVKVDQIASVPFAALLAGMLDPDLLGKGPRPVNLSGFLSVVREQTMDPGHRGQRFGDRSYAIIAEKYLNFSSRVGYHYSVIDAYCGDTINKNYITFTFKGGAADSVRKNRRVRAISLILSEEGYKVSVKGDKVDARLQKYPKSYMIDRINSLGRLLIFTRQMDMLMATEESVEWAARNFLAGNYHLST